MIFLTAVSDEVNLVQGLELGADDYITKPYRVKRTADADVGDTAAAEIQRC